MDCLGGIGNEQPAIRRHRRQPLPTTRLADALRTRESALIFSPGICQRVHGPFDEYAWLGRDKIDLTY